MRGEILSALPGSQESRSYDYLQKFLCAAANTETPQGGELSLLLKLFCRRSQKSGFRITEISPVLDPGAGKH